MGHFPRTWKALKVRPLAGDEHPEITEEKYCIYGERHNDYGYTAAYIKKLIQDCSTEEEFRKLIGVASTDKDKVSGSENLRALACHRGVESTER